MSSSRNVGPWIVVVAALGALGAGIWLFAQAGRTGGRSVEPPSTRAAAGERLTSELVQPTEAGPAPPTATEERAAKEHPDWEPMHLVGRVIAAENDRPLADIVLAVREAGGEAVAGARSDEEGRFEILGRAPVAITIQALPRRGLVARRPPHVITEEERAGEEEIELVLVRGTSAPVTGVVVNKHTEEGVFELRVDVTVGELSESVMTDGNGYFTTEVAFPPGPVSAAVFDEPPGGPVAIDSFRREHLKDGRIGAPWELRVDIGPSYLLGSTSGAGIGEGFQAWIEEHPPEPELAAVLDVNAGGFELEPELHERFKPGGSAWRRIQQRTEPKIWPQVPVRPGHTPWIRYSRQVVDAPPENSLREATLRVQGGGRWIGEAEIPTTVGHYPYTVGVPLRACGSVVGAVIDTTETPVKEARVRLVSRGGTELEARETETDDGGAYSFQEVDVGLYHLIVEPKLHAGEKLELRVEQGPNPLPTILLPPALIAGDVAGELFVAAETPHERPFLTLASAEGSSWRRTEVANVAARDEHGTLYTFRFCDVPSGEFDLAVGHLGLRRGGRERGLANFWTPRKQRVYPPRDGIRFECRASDDPQAIFFRVVNTAGAPVPYADIVFGPEGYLLGQYKLRANRPFHLPRGVPIQWTIAARGYQPAKGDESDAVKDGEKHVVEVVLTRGWGATLHVRALASAVQMSRRQRSVLESELYWRSTPAKARVYADGNFVGRTDGEGRIDLSLASRPRKIGVECPGWVGAAVQEMTKDHDEHTEAVLWLEPLGLEKDRRKE